MPGGRPTVYRPENAAIARHACMSGAINQRLAARFSVSRRTVGREVADIAVVSALFARATGMEQKRTKVFCHRGQPVTASYIVYLPPDVRACIFWLRNRRPAQWRENRPLAGEDEEASRYARPRRACGEDAIDAALAEIALIAETPRERAIPQRWQVNPARAEATA